MKVGNSLLASTGLAVIVGVMTGCTSLQSQMGEYDSEIRAYAEDGRWNAANRVIDHAQFKCEPYEMKDVEDWRKRERMGLKLAFAITSLFTKGNWQTISTCLSIQPSTC